MREDRTLRVFGSSSPGVFDAFRDTLALARSLDIGTAPVLFEGILRTAAEVDALLREIHAGPSALGGEREGAVIPVAGAFPLEDFARSVCKSVRAGHVQPDADHWTRRWRPCRTTPVSPGSGAP